MCSSDLAPIVMTSAGSPATFSINGVSINVDSNTTVDDGTANSLIQKINASAAGVTASLIADADGRAQNRIQIISGAGKTLQIGSIGDTSNVLRLLSLADASITGYTASTVTSGMVSRGILSTSVTINGVTTAISQPDNKLERKSTRLNSSH